MGITRRSQGSRLSYQNSTKSLLIIADLHSIFWEKWAVMAAIEDGVKHGCDSVIINGDFMDFYQFSKFSKDPLTIDKVMDEKEWGVDVPPNPARHLWQGFPKNG